MTTLNPNVWFLLAWLAAVVAWDVAVYVMAGPGCTISATLLRAAQRQPLLPLAVCFALGVLAGHLFWPQRLE